MIRVLCSILWILMIIHADNNVILTSVNESSYDESLLTIIPFRTHVPPPQKELNFPVELHPSTPKEEEEEDTTTTTPSSLTGILNSTKYSVYKHPRRQLLTYTTNAPVLSSTLWSTSLSSATVPIPDSLSIGSLVACVVATDADHFFGIIGSNSIGYAVVGASPTISASLFTINGTGCLFTASSLSGLWRRDGIGIPQTVLTLCAHEVNYLCALPLYTMTIKIIATYRISTTVYTNRPPLIDGSVASGIQGKGNYATLNGISTLYVPVPDLLPYNDIAFNLRNITTDADPSNVPAGTLSWELLDVTTVDPREYVVALSVWHLNGNDGTIRLSAIDNRPAWTANPLRNAWMPKSVNGPNPWPASVSLTVRAMDALGGVSEPITIVLTVVASSYGDLGGTGSSNRLWLSDPPELITSLDSNGDIVIPTFTGSIPLYAVAGTILVNGSAFFIDNDASTSGTMVLTIENIQPSIARSLVNVDRSTFTITLAVPPIVITSRISSNDPLTSFAMEIKAIDGAGLLSTNSLRTTFILDDSKNTPSVLANLPANTLTLSVMIPNLITVGDAAIQCGVYSTLPTLVSAYVQLPLCWIPSDTVSSSTLQSYNLQVPIYNSSLSPNYSPGANPVLIASAMTNYVGKSIVIPLVIVEGTKVTANGTSYVSSTISGSRVTTLLARILYANITLIISNSYFPLPCPTGYARVGNKCYGGLRSGCNNVLWDYINASSLCATQMTRTYVPLGTVPRPIASVPGFLSTFSSDEDTRTIVQGGCGGTFNPFVDSYWTGLKAVQPTLDSVLYNQATLTWMVEKGDTDATLNYIIPYMNRNDGVLPASWISTNDWLFPATVAAPACAAYDAQYTGGGITVGNAGLRGVNCSQRLYAAACCSTYVQLVPVYNSFPDIQITAASIIVPANTTVGTIIGNIQALLQISDADSVMSSSLPAGIINITVESVFTEAATLPFVVTIDGLINITDSLLTNIGLHQLTIRAYDGLGARSRNAGIINILVMALYTDTNNVVRINHPPTIVNEFPLAVLPILIGNSSSLSSDYVIARLNASDPDSSSLPAGQFRYRWVKGNNSLLYLNNSGFIFVNPTANLEVAYANWKNQPSWLNEEIFVTDELNGTALTKIPILFSPAYVRTEGAQTYYRFASAPVWTPAGTARTNTASLPGNQVISTTFESVLTYLIAVTSDVENLIMFTNAGAVLPGGRLAFMSLNFTAYDYDCPDTTVNFGGNGEADVTMLLSGPDANLFEVVNITANNASYARPWSWWSSGGTVAGHPVNDSDAARTFALKAVAGINLKNYIGNHLEFSVSFVDGVGLASLPRTVQVLVIPSFQDKWNGWWYRNTPPIATIYARQQIPIALTTPLTTSLGFVPIQDSENINFPFGNITNNAGTLTYAIVSSKGTSSVPFIDMNITTGELFVNDTLDYEYNNNLPIISTAGAMYYDLSITATDGLGETVTTTLLVRLHNLTYDYSLFVNGNGNNTDFINGSSFARVPMWENGGTIYGRSNLTEPLSSFGLTATGMNYGQTINTLSFDTVPVPVGSNLPLVVSAPGATVTTSGNISTLIYDYDFPVVSSFVNSLSSPSTVRFNVSGPHATFIAIPPSSFTDRSYVWPRLEDQPLNITDSRAGRNITLTVLKDLRNLATFGTVLRFTVTPIDGAGLRGPSISFRIRLLAAYRTLGMPIGQYNVNTPPSIVLMTGGLFSNGNTVRRPLIYVPCQVPTGAPVASVGAYDPDPVPAVGDPGVLTFTLLNTLPSNGIYVFGLTTTGYMYIVSDTQLLNMCKSSVDKIVLNVLVSDGYGATANVNITVSFIDAYGRGYVANSRVYMAARNNPSAPQWSLVSQNIAASLTSLAPLPLALPVTVNEPVRYISRTRYDVVSRVYLVDTIPFNFTVEDYDLPLTVQANLSYTVSGSGSEYVNVVPSSPWNNPVVTAWYPVTSTTVVPTNVATNYAVLMNRKIFNYSDYQAYASVDRSCPNGYGVANPLRLIVNTVDGVGLSSSLSLKYYYQFKPTYYHTLLSAYAVSQPPYLLNAQTLNLIFVEGETMVRGTIRIHDFDDANSPAGNIAMVNISVSHVILAETGDAIIAKVAAYRYRIPIPTITTTMSNANDGLGGLAVNITFADANTVLASRTSGFKINIAMVDGLGVCQVVSARIDVTAIAVLIARPVTVAVERRAPAGTSVGYLGATHPYNTSAVLEWYKITTNDPQYYAENWVSISLTGLVTLAKGFNGNLAQQMPVGAHPFRARVCSSSLPAIACTDFRILLGAQDSARVAPQFLLTGNDNFDSSNPQIAPAGGIPPETWPTRSFSNWNFQRNGNAITDLNGNLYVTTDSFMQKGSSFWTTRVSLNPGFTFSFDYMVATVDGGAADGFIFALHTDYRGTGALGDQGGYKGIFSGSDGVYINPAFGLVIEDSYYMPPRTGWRTNFKLFTGNEYVSFNWLGYIPDPFNRRLRVRLSYTGGGINRMHFLLSDLYYGGIVEQEFNLDLASLLNAQTAWIGFTAGTGGGRAAHIVVEGFTTFSGFYETDKCPGSDVSVSSANDMYRCAPPVAEQRYIPPTLPAGYVYGYPIKVLTTDSASYSFVIPSQTQSNGIAVASRSGYLTPGSGFKAACCGVPVCNLLAFQNAAAVYANRYNNATNEEMAWARGNATCPPSILPTQRVYIRVSYPTREAFASLLVLDFYIVNNPSPIIAPTKLYLSEDAYKDAPGAVFPRVGLANSDERAPFARWAILWQSLDNGYDIDTQTGEFSIIRGSVANSAVTVMVQVSVPAYNNSGVIVGRMAVATNITIFPEQPVDDPSAGLQVIGVGCPNGFAIVPGDPNTPTSRCFRYVPSIKPLPYVNGIRETRGQNAADAFCRTQFSTARIATYQDDLEMDWVLRRRCGASPSDLRNFISGVTGAGTDPTDNWFWISREDNSYLLNQGWNNWLSPSTFNVGDKRYCTTTDAYGNGLVNMRCENYNLGVDGENAHTCCVMQGVPIFGEGPTNDPVWYQTYTEKLLYVPEGSYDGSDMGTEDIAYNQQIVETEPGQQLRRIIASYANGQLDTEPIILYARDDDKPSGLSGKLDFSCVSATHPSCSYVGISIPSYKEEELMDISVNNRSQLIKTLIKVANVLSTVGILADAVPGASLSLKFQVEDGIGTHAPFGYAEFAIVPSYQVDGIWYRNTAPFLTSLSPLWASDKLHLLTGGIYSSGTQSPVVSTGTVVDFSPLPTLVSSYARTSPSITPEYRSWYIVEGDTNVRFNLTARDNDNPSTLAGTISGAQVTVTHIVINPNAATFLGVTSTVLDTSAPPRRITDGFAIKLSKVLNTPMLAAYITPPTFNTTIRKTTAANGLVYYNISLLPVFPSNVPLITTFNASLTVAIYLSLDLRDAGGLEMTYSNLRLDILPREARFGSFGGTALPSLTYNMDVPSVVGQGYVLGTVKGVDPSGALLTTYTMSTNTDTVYSALSATNLLYTSAYYVLPLDANLNGTDMFNISSSGTVYVAKNFNTTSSWLPVGETLTILVLGYPNPRSTGGPYHPAVALVSIRIGDALSRIAPSFVTVASGISTDGQLWNYTLNGTVPFPLITSACPVRTVADTALAEIEAFDENSTTDRSLTGIIHHVVKGVQFSVGGTALYSPRTAQILLVSNQQFSSAGYAWTNEEYPLFNGNGFEAQFTVLVAPNPSIISTTEVCEGVGFSFVVHADPLRSLASGGDSGPCLGLWRTGNSAVTGSSVRNLTKWAAITFMHPDASAAVGVFTSSDPTDIRCPSSVSTVSSTSLASRVQTIRHLLSFPGVAWRITVTYVNTVKSITVNLTSVRSDTDSNPPTTAILTFSNIDLSTVIGSTWVTAGFTAGTGSCPSGYSIVPVGWKPGVPASSRGINTTVLSLSTISSSSGSTFNLCHRTVENIFPFRHPSAPTVTEVSLSADTEDLLVIPLAESSLVSSAVLSTTTTGSSILNLVGDNADVPYNARGAAWLPYLLNISAAWNITWSMSITPQPLISSKDKRYVPGHGIGLVFHNDPLGKRSIGNFAGSRFGILGNVASGLGGINFAGSVIFDVFNSSVYTDIYSNSTLISYTSDSHGRPTLTTSLNLTQPIRTAYQTTLADGNIWIIRVQHTNGTLTVSLVPDDGTGNYVSAASVRTPLVYTLWVGSLVSAVGGNTSAMIGFVASTGIARARFTVYNVTLGGRTADTNVCLPPPPAPMACEIHLVPRIATKRSGILPIPSDATSASAIAMRYTLGYTDAAGHNATTPTFIIDPVWGIVRLGVWNPLTNGPTLLTTVARYTSGQPLSAAATVLLVPVDDEIVYPPPLDPMYRRIVSGSYVGSKISFPLIINASSYPNQTYPYASFIRWSIVGSNVSSVLKDGRQGLPLIIDPITGILQIKDSIALSNSVELVVQASVAIPVSVLPNLVSLLSGTMAAVPVALSTYINNRIEQNQYNAIVAAGGPNITDTIIRNATATYPIPIIVLASTTTVTIQPSPAGVPQIGELPDPMVQPSELFQALRAGRSVTLNNNFTNCYVKRTAIMGTIVCTIFTVPASGSQYAGVTLYPPSPDMYLPGQDNATQFFEMDSTDSRSSLVPGEPGLSIILKGGRYDTSSPVPSNFLAGRYFLPVLAVDDDFGISIMQIITIVVLEDYAGLDLLNTTKNWPVNAPSGWAVPSPLQYKDVEPWNPLEPRIITYAIDTSTIIGAFTINKDGQLFIGPTIDTVTGRRSMAAGPIILSIEITMRATSGIAVSYVDLTMYPIRSIPPIVNVTDTDADSLLQLPPNSLPAVGRCVINRTDATLLNSSACTVDLIRSTNSAEKFTTIYPGYEGMNGQGYIFEYASLVSFPPKLPSSILTFNITTNGLMKRIGWAGPIVRGNYVYKVFYRDLVWYTSFTTTLTVEVVGPGEAPMTVSALQIVTGLFITVGAVVNTTTFSPILVDDPEPIPLRFDPLTGQVLEYRKRFHYFTVISTTPPNSYHVEGDGICRLNDTTVVDTSVSSASPATIVVRVSTQTLEGIVNSTDTPLLVHVVSLINDTDAATLLNLPSSAVENRCVINRDDAVLPGAVACSIIREYIFLPSPNADPLWAIFHEIVQIDAPYPGLPQEFNITENGQIVRMGEPKYIARGNYSITGRLLEVSTGTTVLITVIVEVIGTDVPPIVMNPSVEQNGLIIVAGQAYGALTLSNLDIYDPIAVPVLDPITHLPIPGRLVPRPFNYSLIRIEPNNSFIVDPGLGTVMLIDPAAIYVTYGVSSPLINMTIEIITYTMEGLLVSRSIVQIRTFNIIYDGTDARNYYGFPLSVTRVGGHCVANRTEVIFIGNHTCDINIRDIFSRLSTGFQYTDAYVDTLNVRQTNSPGYPHQAFTVTSSGEVIRYGRSEYLPRGTYTLQVPVYRNTTGLSSSILSTFSVNSVVLIIEVTVFGPDHLLAFLNPLLITTDGLLIEYDAPVGAHTMIPLTVIDPEPDIIVNDTTMTIVGYEPRLVTYVLLDSYPPNTFNLSNDGVVTLLDYSYWINYVPDLSNLTVNITTWTMEGPLNRTETVMLNADNAVLKLRDYYYFAPDDLWLGLPTSPSVVEAYVAYPSYAQGIGYTFTIIDQSIPEAYAIDFYNGTLTVNNTVAVAGHTVNVTLVVGTWIGTLVTEIISITVKSQAPKAVGIYPPFGDEFSGHYLPLPLTMSAGMTLPIPIITQDGNTVQSTRSTRYVTEVILHSVHPSPPLDLLNSFTVNSLTGYITLLSDAPLNPGFTDPAYFNTTLVALGVLFRTTDTSTGTKVNLLQKVYLQQIVPNFPIFSGIYNADPTGNTVDKYNALLNVSIQTGILQNIPYTAVSPITGTVEGVNGTIVLLRNELTPENITGFITIHTANERFTNIGHSVNVWGIRNSNDTAFVNLTASTAVLQERTSTVNYGLSVNVDPQACYNGVNGTLWFTIDTVNTKIHPMDGNISFPIRLVTKAQANVTQCGVPTNRWEKGPLGSVWPYIIPSSGIYYLPLVVTDTLYHTVNYLTIAIHIPPFATPIIALWEDNYQHSVYSSSVTVGARKDPITIIDYDYPPRLLKYFMLYSSMEDAYSIDMTTGEIVIENSFLAFQGPVDMTIEIQWELCNYLADNDIACPVAPQIVPGPMIGSTQIDITISSEGKIQMNVAPSATVTPTASTTPSPGLDIPSTIEWDIRVQIPTAISGTGACNSQTEIVISDTNAPAWILMRQSIADITGIHISRISIDGVELCGKSITVMDRWNETLTNINLNYGTNSTKNGWNKPLPWLYNSTSRTWVYNDTAFQWRTDGIDRHRSQPMGNINSRPFIVNTTENITNSLCVSPDPRNQLRFTISIIIAPNEYENFTLSLNDALTELGEVGPGGVYAPAPAVTVFIRKPSISNTSIVVNGVGPYTADDDGITPLLPKCSKYGTTFGDAITVWNSKVLGSTTAILPAPRLFGNMIGFLSSFTGIPAENFVPVLENFTQTIIKGSIIYPSVTPSVTASPTSTFSGLPSLSATPLSKTTLLQINFPIVLGGEKDAVSTQRKDRKLNYDGTPTASICNHSLIQSALIPSTGIVARMRVALSSISKVDFRDCFLSTIFACNAEGGVAINRNHPINLQTTEDLQRILIEKGVRQNVSDKYGGNNVRLLSVDLEEDNELSSRLLQSSTNPVLDPKLISKNTTQLRFIFGLTAVAGQIQEAVNILYEKSITNNNDTTGKLYDGTTTNPSSAVSIGTGTLQDDLLLLFKMVIPSFNASGLYIDGDASSLTVVRATDPPFASPSANSVTNAPISSLTEFGHHNVLIGILAGILATCGCCLVWLFLNRRPRGNYKCEHCGTVLLSTDEYQHAKEKDVKEIMRHHVHINCPYYKIIRNEEEFDLGSGGRSIMSGTIFWREHEATRGQLEQKHFEIAAILPEATPNSQTVVRNKNTKTIIQPKNITPVIPINTLPLPPPTKDRKPKKRTISVNPSVKSVPVVSSFMNNIEDPDDDSVPLTINPMKTKRMNDIITTVKKKNGQKTMNSVNGNRQSAVPKELALGPYRSLPPPVISPLQRTDNVSNMLEYRSPSSFMRKSGFKSVSSSPSSNILTKTKTYEPVTVGVPM